MKLLFGRYITRNNPRALLKLIAQLQNKIYKLETVNEKQKEILNVIYNHCKEEIKINEKESDEMLLKNNEFDDEEKRRINLLRMHIWEMNEILSLYPKKRR